MDESTPGQGNSSQTPTTPHNHTLMGVLCYLGILVTIPLVMAKDDAFVKFHAKQGLVLAIIGIAVWFLSMNMWSMWQLFQLVNLGVIILSIIGIINVIGNKQVEIPLVGSLAKHFKF